MLNIARKSALALAVAAASSGVHAAGTITYKDIDGSTDTSFLTLATEVFGTDSENTLINAPTLNYTVDAAADNVDAAHFVTFKVTLDKGAVFGQDLSSAAKWISESGVKLRFIIEGSTTASAAYTVNDGTGTLAPVFGGAGDLLEEFQVTQGGAIGDNTVTFRLKVKDDSAAPTETVEAVKSIRIGGYKVKSLKNALNSSVAETARVVKFGVEYRNLTVTTRTDTASPQPIFKSQAGVDLTGTPTTYAAAGGRQRIQVAASERQFTQDAGAAASDDFTNQQLFASLGTLRVVRTAFLNAQNASTTVQKEDGNEFDFNAGDTPSIRVTSTAPLTGLTVYLRAGGACTATTGGTDKVGTAVAGDANSTDISLAGQTTTELDTGYNLCLVANGTVTIPESTISAALTVDYFNPRYTDSADTLSYGDLLRNGCQVTLFNVPGPTASDVPFIRLSNISAVPGAVRGFMWAQDGTRIPTSGAPLVAAAVPAHGTAVLSTAELSAAFPGYASQTTGRNRLILQGAFPGCEALGLVRSPAGVLTNMTSTTYGGSTSTHGSVRNNTSNTSN